MHFYETHSETKMSDALKNRIARAHTLDINLVKMTGEPERIVSIPESTPFFSAAKRYGQNVRDLIDILDYAFRSKDEGPTSIREKVRYLHCIPSHSFKSIRNSAHKSARSRRSKCGESTRSKWTCPYGKLRKTDFQTLFRSILSLRTMN